MKMKLAALLLLTATAFAGSAMAAERTVTLKVEGMNCVLCAPTVKMSLAKVAGVTRVEVSAAKETAIVTFEDTKTDVNALTAATRNAGYPSHPAP